ncbi:ImmA/IrrE family metallo-endopeptidase [Actinokineospora sp.]|uniref:ImmA/IrrE family metallo-endopeptidase n=1 Tax=Actinokineospora sp. TaxID=1872133 RepID=UPI003D6AC66D
MSVRVDVQGQLISWARERSGISLVDLLRRFPKLEEWENDVASPTLKQLEDYANATHTPLGLLFLDEPPDEPLPLPDFRTINNQEIRRPSVDLLDTIYECQTRQEWYRDHALVTYKDPVDLVGSATPIASPARAVSLIRSLLDFGSVRQASTWSEALRRLIEQVERLGILVMVNGVVGTNTSRKLNPREFRGFALVDRLAPLIFVNGADTKAAQVFTVVHELAHIAGGVSGVSDSSLEDQVANETERWCNEVAAELLVPVIMIRDQYRPRVDLTDELDRLARVFKVSTLVILRRLRDVGFVPQSDYGRLYETELARVMSFVEERSGSDGGNFYATQAVRVGRLFARELLTSTFEGRTTYREAFQMLGVRKMSTFSEFARRLEVNA